jgi:hypothetical protein
LVFWSCLDVVGSNSGQEVVELDLCFVFLIIKRGELGAKYVGGFSPLVLLKCETLALLSLYTVGGKCVYFSIFE